MTPKILSWVFFIVSVVTMVVMRETFGWLGLGLGLSLFFSASASVYFDCAHDIQQVLNKELDYMIKKHHTQEPPAEGFEV